MAPPLGVPTGVQEYKLIDSLENSPPCLALITRRTLAGIACCTERPSVVWIVRIAAGCEWCDVIDVGCRDDESFR